MRTIHSTLVGVLGANGGTMFTKHVQLLDNMKSIVPSGSSSSVRLEDLWKAGEQTAFDPQASKH